MSLAGSDVKSPLAGENKRVGTARSESGPAMPGLHEIKQFL